MKNYLFFFSLFFVFSCASNNSVYWCGDHACINKKEKEAYFKKTMIVEVKDSKNKTNKNKSQIEKLIQQSQIDEKKRIKKEKELAKQAIIDEKIRIKEEKILAKKIKLEEKRRIKEEKILAKKIQLEEKRRIKEEKALAKSIELEKKREVKINKKLVKNKIVKEEKINEEKTLELDAGIGKVKIDLNKFSDLVEKITKKNSLRPFPDINDIPN